MSVRMMMQGRQPAAGGSFSPDDIAGLIGWFEADAISGLSDNDTVNTWPDQSSAGDDGIWNNGTNPPKFYSGILNGQPIVRYDAAQNTQIITPMSQTTKPFTVVAVVKPVASGNTRAIVGPPNNTSGLTWYIAGSNVQGMDASGSVHIGTSSTAVTTGVASVLAATYTSDGTYTFYLNGASDGSATSNQAFGSSTDGTSLSTNRTGAGFYGDIAAILKYDSVLSSGDLDDLFDYLGTKYGVSV